MKSYAFMGKNRSRDEAQGPMTNLMVSSAGGDSPNRPGEKVQATPSAIGYTDWRSLLDDGACSDAIARPMCDASAFIQNKCEELDDNVATTYLTKGLKETSRDYQQGARTSHHVEAYVSRLAMGSPIVGMFTGARLDALEPGGGGYVWGVVVWSELPDPVVAGFRITFARPIIDTTEALITITNDPNFIYQRLISTGPNVYFPTRAVPPLSLYRNEADIRGKTGQSLQLKFIESAGGVDLANIYRTTNNMDTGQADLARLRVVPFVDDYAWLSTVDPPPPANLSAGGVAAFIIRSTTPLASVRIQPIAFNNVVTPEALSNFKSGGGRKKS